MSEGNSRSLAICSGLWARNNGSNFWHNQFPASFNTNFIILGSSQVCAMTSKQLKTTANWSPGRWIWARTNKSYFWVNMKLCHSSSRPALCTEELRTWTRRFDANWETFVQESEAALPNTLAYGDVKRKNSVHSIFKTKLSSPDRVYLLVEHETEPQHVPGSCTGHGTSLSRNQLNFLSCTRIGKKCKNSTKMHKFNTEPKLICPTLLIREIQFPDNLTDADWTLPYKKPGLLRTSKKTTTILKTF